MPVLVEYFIAGTNSNVVDESAFCFWEAEYEDGSVDRESEGNSYLAINRYNLQKFRLIYQSQIVFETWPPSLEAHLIYRRRRTITPVGISTIFIIGWVPTGPVFCVDPIEKTYRKEDRFLPGDPQLYPPHPLPSEKWTQAIQ